MNFDFGYAPQGEKVYHTFYIRNDGTETLHIEEVKPSCGCTTIPLTTKSLAVGDSLALNLEFNTQRFNGIVHKNVKITTNSVDSAVSRLFISANINEVHPSILLDKQFADFRTFGVTERQIQVSNGTADTLKATLVSSPPDYLSITMPKSTIPPQGTATVTFTLIRQPPPGDFFSSATLEFEGTSKERITIPIKGLAVLD